MTSMPHSQRMRFIRSMKKLGDLLTETQNMPALVEGPLPSPVDSTSTPTSSRTFFSLRLPSAATKFPLSATFAISVSIPTTPLTPAAIDPAALTAHNIAKAKALLGEDVPPELVKGRKRSSTVSVPEFRTGGGAGTRRAARTLKHVASSTSLRRPRPPPPAPAPAPADDSEPFSYASLVAAQGSDAAPTVPVLFEPKPKPTTSRSTYRKEAGWSGEWSGCVRDLSMEDVVRRLRKLRA
ncbi:hypothetical protein MKEN_00834800 [Mycena kentingensis (nom. inval.)]|nr:hypothetical protein MKEN_00834800 [Mycena kentingensis (nom. inval.)]